MGGRGGRDKGQGWGAGEGGIRGRDGGRGGRDKGTGIGAGER